jgi:XTP/dITP diphosphohydrolase
VNKPLVFATNNPNKLREVRMLLGEGFDLLSLEDIGCREELPETGDTLEHNAREKAEYVQQRFGGQVFAEDTGLIVDALGGEPGVYSARYAGPEADAQKNMALLLERLGDNPHRQARFRTVISLFWEGNWHHFIGECPGWIGLEPTGQGGFGYDPVFYPELEAGRSALSFAQMPSAEKNTISHRGKAVQALIAFLQSR